MRKQLKLGKIAKEVLHKFRLNLLSFACFQLMLVFLNAFFATILNFSFCFKEAKFRRTLYPAATVKHATIVRNQNQKILKKEALQLLFYFISEKNPPSFSLLQMSESNPELLPRLSRTLSMIVRKQCNFQYKKNLLLTKAIEFL